MDNTRAADALPAQGHVAPLWLYGVIYLALITLTGVTVGAAFLDLGPLSTAVALGIAGLKASLVALYFMHVRWSSRLIPLSIFAGLFWLVHLIAGLLADYFTRGWLNVPGR